MKRKMLLAGAALALVAFAYQVGEAEQELADFELVVEATSTGAELRCNKGCAWTELSFACGEGETCMGIVDEFGVSGAKEE